MWLYLVNPYESAQITAPGSNLAQPGVGFTSFTWAYVGKTLEISLYLAIRPRATEFCMWLYLLVLYRKCLNYSPGGQNCSQQGKHKFYMDIYGENLKNLPVLSHTALGYQILPVPVPSGPTQRAHKLQPWG